MWGITTGDARCPRRRPGDRESSSDHDTRPRVHVPAAKEPGFLAPCEVVNKRTDDFGIIFHSVSWWNGGEGHGDEHYAGHQFKGRIREDDGHDQPRQLLRLPRSSDDHTGLRSPGVEPELGRPARPLRNDAPWSQRRAAKRAAHPQHRDARAGGYPATSD